MNGFVAAGYGITFATLLLYTWRILVRARAVARQLPEGERTWR